MQHPLNIATGKNDASESNLCMNKEEVADNSGGRLVMLATVFSTVLGGYLACLSLLIFMDVARWWVVLTLFILGTMLGGLVFYDIRRYLSNSTYLAGVGQSYDSSRRKTSRLILLSLRVIIVVVAIFSGAVCSLALGAFDNSVLNFFSIILDIEPDVISNFLLWTILLSVACAGIILTLEYSYQEMNEKSRITRPAAHKPPTRYEKFSTSYRSSSCTSVKGIEIQHWIQFNGSTNSHTKPRAFCIGSIDPSSRMLSLGPQIKCACDISVDLCNDIEWVLEAVKVSPSAWNLIIIDIDHVEKVMDLDDIVRTLIDFRQDCNSVAIIILSDSFAMNDSSLVRSAIADYSFRLSVSDQTIIKSLPEVFENHREWRRRSEATGLLLSNSSVAKVF